MRLESVAWERAAEVREAAEGWWRAGAIDQSTFEAIQTAYPDPCLTPSAVWRVLTAVMVTAVALSTFGAVWIAAQPGPAGLSLVLLVLAAALVGVTERLQATPRLARRGAAGATAFWAGLFVLAGLLLLLHESLGVRTQRVFDVVLVVSVLGWGAGCRRWGHPLFAGFSAISLLVLLGRWPFGRVLWMLAGSALAGLAARHVDDAAWAPSHRRAAMVMVVTGVIAVYAAVNVYSLDEHLLEGLRGLARPRVPPRRGLLVLAAVATAVLPLMILVWAWTSRWRFLLDTGLVLLAVSLVTLRHYVHVAPLWVALTTSGALLIAAALAVERTLRRRPAGEWGGVTAEPLFSDERRQQLLQAVPVVAAFTPAASAPSADEQGFGGRDGTFGGGGASEKF